MTYQELGQFIKQERNKLQLAQQGLADLAGISKRTLQNVEKGQQTHNDTLKDILKILSFDLEIDLKVTEKVK